MYKFQLYIGEDLVELFKDETITLNSSVQNIMDISKVFTDFTQSFTVPASQQNNRLFTHWYNVDITGGFTSATRSAATIELNSLPFKTGLVQLENVIMRNNKPFSYKITFYGSTVNLTDLFGEDKLNDLDTVDLKAYQHDFDSANVILGLEGAGLFSGDIIYPLISPVRNWLWDSADVDDIFYESASLPSTTNGIVWNELKPAIRLTVVLDAVQDKYGITFSTDFFGTADFAKLFLWMNREKGLMQTPGLPTVVTIGGDTLFPIAVDAGSPSDNVVMTVTPTAGFETIPYSIIVEYNSLDVGGIRQVSHDKVDIGSAGWFLTYPPEDNGTVEFSVQSNENFSFTANIPGEGTSATIITNGKVYVTDTLILNTLHKGQFPDMTVTNFIKSLFNCFNLTTIPTSATDFEVRTLDDWYTQGSVFNLTENNVHYINIDKVEINRPNLHKIINFNYQESETILADQFRETNGIGYGDLEHEEIYDGGTLEINPAFENIIHERLSSQDDGALSDTHVGKIIDDDLEPAKINPIFFYNREITTLTTLTNGIAFINDATTKVEILAYNNVGPENALTNGATTNSLNFGAEVSSWAQIPQTASLFNSYWEDYIGDLYDIKRRIFNYKARFPLNIITRLKLNDVLIIKERAYIINTMNINFTTGETKLELLNFIGELTGTSVNKFFEYDLNIEV